MNPHRLTWGFAYTAPYAMLIALATIGGLCISFFTKQRHHLPFTREVFLLLGLWGIYFMSTMFAIDAEAARDQLERVSKILLMTFVTIFLFQDLTKLRWLMIVIAFSIGFYGLKGGLFALIHRGEWMVFGPPDSFIGANTALGLALNMMLPIFLFLRNEESNTWMRNLFLATFIFSILASLFTYSRGALIGLVVVLFLLVLKSRFKVLAVVLLIIGTSVVASMAPEKWLGRIRTIETYEEDASAMARIRAWQLSYQIARDRPMLGGGFEVFSPEIYVRYLPYDLLITADVGTGAHSNYFQVLAEHGFTGLALYVGLIISVLMSLREIKRKARDDPAMKWFYNCANMMQVSIVGYCVSGIFLSMSYFDLYYHLVAITIVLKKMVQSREKGDSQISSGEQKSPLP